VLRDLLRPPSLLKARKVLCIQPHPDDIEWAAGGTVADLTQAGAEVIYVTVSDGSWGTLDPELDKDELVTTRRREQTAAADILGVGEIVWLDYPDGQVPPGNTPSLRDHLVKLIRSYGPDCVMAPDPWMPYEAHPDHYNTGLAAAASMLFSGLPPAHREEGLETHTPEMIAFYNTSRPNTWVPVDGTWARKEAALEAHESQFGSPVGEMQKAFVKIQAEELAARGKAVGALEEGVSLAEAFKVLGSLHLHCNWETVNC